MGYNRDEYDFQPRMACPVPPPVCPPWFEGPVPPQYPGPLVSFGSVPPSSPARGTLWWNGTILQIWDGVAWMPTGGAGDITGTAASPGAVGEVVTALFAQLLSVTGTDQSFTVPLTVPAGDWDCFASLSYDGPASGVSFGVIGYPVSGLVPNLAAAQPASTTAVGCVGASRFLTPANVVLNLKVTVLQPTTNNTLNFRAWARRAR